MVEWQIMTCALEGASFIPKQTLSWPVPLTGEVGLELEQEPGQGAERVEFELQTDFSGNFSAYSSNGRFELRFLYTERLGEHRYLTGAVIRHRPSGEDVETFTAITRASD